MSNWSELPHDLLVEIAGRVKRLEDFIVFGAVCKGWCKAGKKEHFKGLWLRPTTPYLLLPVRDGSDDVREFYCLIERKVVASLRIPKFKKRKCHESLGWLLAVEEDGSMCLLDPFTSVEIPVPHQRTLPGNINGNSLDEYVFVRKMVLSARPSETSHFILMIICGDSGHLAFWRPGDKSWNKIELVEIGGCHWDVMYHDGHFYAAGGRGCACWVYTIEKDCPPKCEIVTRLVKVPNYHNNCEIINDRSFYVLKTARSLFMITRLAHWFSEEEERFGYTTSKFQVYEVDVSIGTCVEINDIGIMAVFVGHNATFAVDSSGYNGKIKGNHIYFSDDWESYHFDEEKGGGKDMGAYNMMVGNLITITLMRRKVVARTWVHTIWRREQLSRFIQERFCLVKYVFPYGLILTIIYL